MKSRVPALGVLALSLLLGGCYTVPETGRKSVILPLVNDVAQGAAAFADLKAKEPISSDAEKNERVQRVGKRIAIAVGDALPGAQWEFVVFYGPTTVNAFALPGGKVGIYTGLLDLVESDDEIAIVMGHEIAHVTSRHGAERMSQNIGAAFGALGVGLATNNSSNRDAWRLAYGAAAVGTILAYSRKHESEADFIGIRYAAKAGYDPRAAISFWQKMAAAGTPSKLPVFLSTHPSHDRRIRELREWMPETMQLYEAAKVRHP
jgi:predicted Zn-dependent protease